MEIRITFLSEVRSCGHTLVTALLSSIKKEKEVEKDDKTTMDSSTAASVNMPSVPISARPTVGARINTVYLCLQNWKALAVMVCGGT